MTNNTTVFFLVSTDALLFVVGFKFIAMIIGVLGNVTVIIYAIFSCKEKTMTTYLVGNLALADLLVCLTFYPVWIIEFLQVLLNIDGDQDLFCKLSRSTAFAFMFASVAGLLAITVDRYLYFSKPLKYPLIVTSRRVLLAVSGIWLTACCVFIVWWRYIRRFSNGSRSFCYIPDAVGYPIASFGSYFPLLLIFLFNFKILFLVRKQRKRILAETKMIVAINNCNDEIANEMSFVAGFFVALKTAKTFSIVFATLTLCILTPTILGHAINIWGSDSDKHIWFIVLHYEFYGLNSIVNAFIYGMRHIKYRKAYFHTLFKLFSCRKPVNWATEILYIIEVRCFADSKLKGFLIVQESDLIACRLISKAG